MIDETSGIIGWPIGQQYRERAALNEASTTTWETLVEQYRERAARDDARIDELTQRANHWHDTAQMLKRQRDTAEEDRDGWKIRAMKSEQQRQALRAECEALHTTNTNLFDQFILAEGQRDQAKADAEHWKGEWAVVMGQLGGARAEVEAVKQRAEEAEASRGEAVAGAEYRRKLLDALETRCAAAEAERDALRKDAALLDALQAEHERFDPVAALVVKCRHDRNGSDWANITGDIRAALDAALAVQP